MIGAATESTQPGGIVEIDDKTGAFLGHFGPGPSARPAGSARTYMYDFESLPEANRGISTTFGSPALCAAASSRAASAARSRSGTFAGGR